MAYKNFDELAEASVKIIEEGIVNEGFKSIKPNYYLILSMYAEYMEEYAKNKKKGTKGFALEGRHTDNT